MTVDTAVEFLLRRDRAVVIAGLVGITLLAWFYLATFTFDMPPMDITDSMAGMDMSGGMGGMAMEGMAETPADVSAPRPWTTGDGLTMFSMWAIMMAAMMTPSAAPMILLYALVSRKRMNAAIVPTGAFYLGYLVVWIVFSVGATALQWGLGQFMLLSPMFESASPTLTGVLLIAAGIYQWTPAKRACLHQCRSPVDFLSKHWRPERWGAFRMGLEHGAFCLGCCWTLMLVLFVGGVMNLLWVAAIAVLILIEKITPLGRQIALIGGAAFITAGLIILL
jgi:predicted metal-binding membrane protein